ncbi:Ribosomal family S4e [Oesophagostomum dentatum]|uniref:Small ribosomal subunit protein eS4 n=1 Tax=Oesophagostomum dentatum TaxID=61180 RepID=A0A0B1TCB0_OESDE|nr:Ribosomal family S4e [Oesophagostomum dentatum]
MARGPRKHLKRLAAPKHWMLDKLGGVFAVRPRSGPHKLRECLPINLFLRNRLKYALNYSEVKRIMRQRVIKIDGKVRTDHKYPAGFMDVISIERTNETFRLLYDVKGRYTVHRITAAEGQFKLCKVKALHVAKGNIPFITTNDGRTIRYPDPHIKVNDTVVIDLSTNKITDFVKFEPGNLAMITGGRNVGRVGVIGHREKLPGAFDIIHVKDSAGHSFATRLRRVLVSPTCSLSAKETKPSSPYPHRRVSVLQLLKRETSDWLKRKLKCSVNDTVVIDLSTNKITDFVKFEPGNLAMITGGRNVGRVGVIGHREKLPGAFDIIHVKDSAGHSFATRVSNVFVIGKGNKALVSLPASKGIRLTIAEERDKRLAQKKA